jgi:hypothetical protein
VTATTLPQQQTMNNKFFSPSLLPPLPFSYTPIQSSIFRFCNLSNLHFTSVALNHRNVNLKQVQQCRLHGSHNHSNELLTTDGYHVKGDRKSGWKITWLGLWSNVALTSAKAVGGYILNSPVLIADAFHSGGDLVSDGITLVTFKLSNRPPTQLFPYGNYSNLYSIIPRGYN